jgi:hypothetical protein
MPFCEILNFLKLNSLETPKEKSPRELFKELLKEKGMTANWSWEQVMNATKNDARWKLLKMADKKNAYQEYAQELRRQERVRCSFLHRFFLLF